MSEGQQFDGSTELTNVDVVRLQARLAAKHQSFEPGEGAVSVRDVAEATGMSESDVLANLRSIRAESAFREPDRAKPSALIWIAGATLAFGAGVTWFRLRSTEVPIPQLKPPVTVAHPELPDKYKTTPLVSMDLQSYPFAPPSGLRVEAIGQSTDVLGDGMQAKVTPVGYAATVDGLCRSAEGVIAYLIPRDSDSRKQPNARYHGMNGGIFSPRPGFVHLSMFGWAGNETDWIAVPLTEAGRNQIRQLAVNLLEDSKKAQDAALAPVADPTAGIVSPPPAFKIEFTGRRIDIHDGPARSFTDVPKADYARRLEAALINAAVRDRIPPRENYSGDSIADAKIPLPPRSHVEITGPRGTVSGVVPTVVGKDRELRSALKEIARKAAELID